MTLNERDLAAVPESILSRLRNTRRAWILIHRRPDPDTIGAAISVAELIIAMGGDAEVIADEALSIIEGSSSLPALEAGPDPVRIMAPDRVFMVDCASDERTGGLLARHAATLATVPVSIIDHHPADHMTIDDESWVDATAAAACEMAVMLALRLGVGMDRPRFVRAAAAGLITDSGAFGHPSVKGRTLRAGAALIDAGAPIADTIRWAFRTSSIARMRLHARAIARMRLLAGGRVAFVRIRAADYAATAAGPEDAEGIANRAIEGAGVEIALMVADMTDGTLRLSARSHPGTSARSVAQAVGGGGHEQAAGATLSETDLPLLLRAARAAVST